MLATAKVFAAHTGNVNLHEVVLVTTNDASCFDASWLSFNLSAADFLQYMFIEAAVYPESRGSHCDCGGRMYA